DLDHLREAREPVDDVPVDGVGIARTKRDGTPEPAVDPDRRSGAGAEAARIEERRRPGAVGPVGGDRRGAGPRDDAGGGGVVGPEFGVTVGARARRGETGD